MMKPFCLQSYSSRRYTIGFSIFSLLFSNRIDLFVFTPTPRSFDHVAERFSRRWNFYPNCMIVSRFYGLSGSLRYERE
jgi:hypothetical protein